jgi:hypothetical protein
MKILRMDTARRTANDRYRARMKDNPQYLARQRERAALRRAQTDQDEVRAALIRLALLPVPVI